MAVGGVTGLMALWEIDGAYGAAAVLFTLGALVTFLYLENRGLLDRTSLSRISNDNPQSARHSREDSPPSA